MVVLGKFLETYAKGKTAKAINELTNHRARSARLIIDDEVIQHNISLGYSISNYLSDYKLLDNSNDIEIDVSLVQRGDCLRLISGESIPADGLLTIGTISVDESMLTGESKSVIKEPGSPVYGGTIIVEGSGNMIVTACGDESALGKIISAVQEAQSSRPPIQELADKIARYLVPIIAFISLLTFFVWVIVWASGTNNGSSSHGNPILFAFFFALAVWVSACPCSFGLATPTAILVSTGLAAKYGILIRKGAAIQHITEANVIAFDKTGESRSNHPIAQSILNYCTKKLVDFNDDPIDIVKLADDDIDIEIVPGLAKTQGLNAGGKIVIYISIDIELVGIISLSDTVRPEAFGEMNIKQR
eukprot:gene16807-22290_t